MNRPSLIECMLKAAEVFAERSTCSRLKVGCVITNEDMTCIDSIGYNGGAKGLSNEPESDKPGQSGFIHAEINALIKANYNIKNKRMFITHSPCKMCAKSIVNGGITSVYFSNLYRDSTSLEILYKAGIQVHWIDGDKLKYFHGVTDYGDLIWSDSFSIA